IVTCPFWIVTLWSPLVIEMLPSWSTTEVFSSGSSASTPEPREWPAMPKLPPRREVPLSHRSSCSTRRFVRKAPVRVRLVLRCHYIEGNVFVDSAATDPASFFLRTTEKNNDRFLAVTSSTVSSAAGTTDEVGLAIVNGSAVRLFSAAHS